MAAVISLSAIGVDLPSSDWNAGLNALMSARSPRQCSSAVPGSPRRLCVTIGPFIGW